MCQGEAKEAGEERGGGDDHPSSLGLRGVVGKVVCCMGLLLCLLFPLPLLLPLLQIIGGCLYRMDIVCFIINHHHYQLFHYYHYIFLLLATNTKYMCVCVRTCVCVFGGIRYLDIFLCLPFKRKFSVAYFSD